MKRYIMLLVFIIIISACSKTSPISDEEIIVHKEAIIANNEIDSQSFINDYIGIQLELPAEYEIYEYEDLNTSTMPTDKNLIMYASMKGSEIIFIVESLYDGSNYRNETIKELEKENNEKDIKIKYQESDTVIGDKEAYYVKVIEEFDDNKKMYMDYYIIEQRESLLSIVLTYDEKTDMSILKELIEGIEFY